MARLVRAVMGVQTTAAQAAACGARICDLERSLAQREGLSSRDDRLPWRILEEPVQGGENDGLRLGSAAFARMLSEYYALRRWGPQGTAPALAVRHAPAGAGSG
jgi:aldehyde:ferredoxin oxidoreductase